MKKSLTSLIISTALFASASSPTLDEAIETLKTNNLEIKTATIEAQSAAQEKDIAKGNHYGKLDLTQDIARSNDAGNVFGFKLTSREATFGDFGFADFNMANPNILTVQPDDLNYPEARNFFQTKLKYEVPLFTGFKISSYEEITASMEKIKKLEKSQVENEKIYELKKSFYDMALLEKSIANLKTILSNINTLEKMTNEMIAVGYAKKVDILEVQAKK